MKKKQIRSASIAAIIGVLLSIWILYPLDVFGSTLESTTFRFIIATIVIFSAIGGWLASD